MTTAQKPQMRAIPQRGEIDDRFKWNLADIYESNDAWEADFKKAESIISEVGKFSGRLGSSAALLYECLETRTELLRTCNDLFQYAKLNQDLDNRVSEYQAKSNRAAMLSSRASAALAYLEPELLAIDDAKLTAMAEQFPETDVHDFYIKELIRSRAHIRSAEVEEVLAQAAMIARGPDEVFTMLDDADIKYPSVTDEKGDEVQLTKQRYARFMESPVQRVRRDAHESLLSAYKDHINTLAANLSTNMMKDTFYARARKYESTLHHALDAGNIPVSVFHSLLDTTESDLSALHKWIGLRKKVLGIDNIYPYDLFCPLFPEQNYDVPYEQAVQEVLKAVAPLGDEYCSILKRGFDNRWVDVYETEGKGGGAYNWANYSTHPFVKMNYNDTVNNMFTLAHEMGHAMHSFLSNRTQPYTKARFSIFVAEVASTLNEGLLLQHLLKKADDKKQKLFLLNRHIDNTFATFFHQVNYARFELTIHETIEKGEALSADKLNELWENLRKKYLGPEMTFEEFEKYKWSRIPHFYMSYYVYQYATSYAASQAILGKFLAGEESIVDRYLELLSSGGSDYPIDQLQRCGVDMTTPEPVLATIKLFSEQVDEVERLVGAG